MRLDHTDRKFSWMEKKTSSSNLRRPQMRSHKAVVLWKTSIRKRAPVRWLRDQGSDRTRLPPKGPRPVCGGHVRCSPYAAGPGRQLWLCGAFGSFGVNSTETPDACMEWKSSMLLLSSRKIFKLESTNISLQNNNFIIPWVPGDSHLLTQVVCAARYVPLGAYSFTDKIFFCWKLINFYYNLMASF